MQASGRKRGRPSSEDSSDGEMVAPELLDPMLGSQRKKARLGYRGRQWITVFGSRLAMKQRRDSPLRAPQHPCLDFLCLQALMPLPCRAQIFMHGCRRSQPRMKRVSSCANL